MRNLQRIAVLGAGTMGARIAAHFANAGVPSLLFDVAAAGQADRNQAAKKGLEGTLKQRPSGFFVERNASLIACANFEDDLGKLSSCDWIIEAVTENLEVKRNLWSRVAGVCAPGAILTTNTSGIPLAKIASGFPEEFRRRFLGTHFFNPPRYLHLCEVIPTPDTDPEIVAFTSEFCDRRLGKGVVECKDTPNFIGNRIGCFWGATIYKYAAEGSYTIEEVDALTGSLIGLPNSASFRLIDIVGLDVWAHVGRNLFDLVPADPWRDRFLPPPFVDEMLRRKWLGEKTGSGFYRRTGPEKTIEALDLETFEYRPARKVSFESVETARNIEFLPDRLRKLVTSEDRAGSFLWEVCRDAVLYAAERIPEISGRIVEVDRAMRWGYAHTYGPFELWDALGFAETANRIEADGFALPEWVAKMRAGGASGFYSSERGSTSYFDLAGASYRTLEARPGITVLTDLRQAGKVVKANPGASLIDLGDGVLCLEFHTKLNTLGEDIFSMIHTAADETERNWQALVVGNQGGDFCVGANLKMVLLAAQQGKWDEIDAAVANFQRGVMRLKYLPRPVVAAPFGRTLGGGAEITLHAARVQASAELYMGLVEAGVGLIPAGGGCKEAILRWKDPRRAFEAIGMARVSSSAEDARDIGYLSAADRISMNQERLVEDAKQLALSLARDWTPAVPVGVPVTGEAGYALMKMGAWMAHQGGYISEYDLVIAEKLARVASGGRITGEQVVGEKYLLDLEREAFLSLCGDERTQARMQHMLKTGKALRN